MGDGLRTEASPRLGLGRQWQGMPDRPSQVTEERRREAEAVMRAAISWAGRDATIRAVALVGSWSRGEPRMDSDVDLVVLTAAPARLLSRSDWTGVFGAVEAVGRRRDFGAIQERRLRLPTGLEIEVGIGSVTWAATPRSTTGLPKSLPVVFARSTTPMAICNDWSRRSPTGSDTFDARGGARSFDNAIRRRVLSAIPMRTAFYFYVNPA